MANVELRPEVQAYAEAIEMRLRKHDADWGTSWKTAPTDILLRHLADKVENLETAVEYDDPTNTLKQAASVGAHAMFVADVCGALNPPTTGPAATEGRGEGA